MPGTRAVAAGRFFVELEGVPCGFVRSVEGGGVRADVVAEPGPEFFEKKHLGALHYDEFTLQADLSLDKSVYAWIADSWTGKLARKDGSIVATDLKLAAVSEREFFRALLTEVTVPAMDAASKEAAHLTVKLAPEYTRARKGSGKAVKAASAKQKLWQQSSFRLEIDELDCTKVSKVDAFTIRQKTVSDQLGEERAPTRQPSKLEVPNLRISLAESSAKTWAAWRDDFLVKGNNDDSQERNGKLVFLAPDLKSPLGEIRLFNLGIFRLEPEAQSAGAQQVARMIAELYCERMELTVA